MKGYVIDASVAIKWLIPEIYSEVALHVSRLEDPLHVPAFIQLEAGSVLAQKIRHNELTKEERNVMSYSRSSGNSRFNTIPMNDSFTQAMLWPLRLIKVCTIVSTSLWPRRLMVL